MLQKLTALLPVIMWAADLFDNIILNQKNRLTKTKGTWQITKSFAKY